jgi:hypothetical protein
MTYGPVPPDYHVHHKDENKTNDSLDNLELLVGKEHNRIHSHRNDIWREGPDGPERKCARCGEFKPLDQISRSKTRVFSYCRDCSNIIKRRPDWNQSGKRLPRESPVTEIDGITYKKCTTCGKFKPLDEFYERKTGQRRPPCKECVREHVREYSRLKRERIEHVNA